MRTSLFSIHFKNQNVRSHFAFFISYLPFLQVKLNGTKSISYSESLKVKFGINDR